jgi:hypothetical protein
MIRSNQSTVREFQGQQPLAVEREILQKMEELLSRLQAFRPARPLSEPTVKNLSVEVVREAMDALKAERMRQGLSLADLRERSGIERSALCKLENDTACNPTLRTLTRYAAAMGKRVRVVLEDAEVAEAVEQLASA